MNAPISEFSSTAMNVFRHNEIVIMENDKNERQIIKNVLSKSGLRVLIASNSSEALTYLEEQNVRYYILDINMGPKKSQEGMDLLEKLKKEDREIFVGVYSGHPEYARNQAVRLQADTFQPKTSDKVADIYCILYELMSYDEAVIAKTKNEVELILKKANITVCPRTKSLASSEAYSANSIREPETGVGERNYYYRGPKQDRIRTISKLKDKNLQTFLKLKSDSNWLTQHKGFYIAIVDGNLIDKDKNKQKLLTRIRLDFPEKRRFVTMIKVNNDIIDIPSPLELN